MRGIAGYRFVKGVESETQLVHDRRVVAEHRIGLDQQLVRGNEPAHAFPGDGHFIERAVVLKETVEAAFGFVSGNPMNMR